MKPTTDPLLLSIDGGTESIRAGCFTMDGRLISSAASAYSTTFPRSGWAEQNPSEWRESLISAVRRCLSAPAVSADAVVAIGLDGTTCTLVALGSDLEPVRPALLWMDVRAGEQARRTTESGSHVLSYCPGGCNAEWMVPKALWLREHEADAYERTAVFVDYPDWLVLELTGCVCLNRNTATQRWFYNDRMWKLPHDLYSRLSMNDVADRIPTEIVPAGDIVGELCGSMAEALGLPAGIPVVEGGGDAFVALTGMGVTEPGRMGLVAGSSNVVAAYSQSEVHAPGLYGGFPDAMMPGLWLVEAGQASAGSVLSWFKRTFARDLPEEAAYEVLDSEAARVPPGAGGLVALETFQGNRSPYADSRARGALWGLSLSTDRAQVFRSLIEGIACGTAQIIDLYRSHDLGGGEIVACGGALKSDLYMQIMCDATGVPISVPAVADAALLGGAVLAAAGIEEYGSIGEAAAAMVRAQPTYEPDAQAHAEYAVLVERQRRTYHQLKDLMHEQGGT